MVPSVNDVQFIDFKPRHQNASENFVRDMDASTVLAVRHTFLQLLPSRGGDASLRKTRSEDPQARMPSLPRHALEAEVVSSDAEANRCTHHMILAYGLGHSLEAGGAEPSACSTPWSSLCGDWGYQGDVSQFEATPVETSCLTCAQIVIEGSTEAVASGSSVCGNGDYQPAPLFELETAPEPGDVGKTLTALDGYPDTSAAWAPWAKRGTIDGAAPTSNAAEDRGGQLASAKPRKAGSYLAALMTFSGAPTQPCGKMLAIQRPSRAPVAVGHCAVGLPTATCSSAKTATSATIREGAAEAIRDKKEATKGRRRGGKRGGRRRRVSNEIATA